MPQQKVPFKTKQTPMSISNLRLQSPIGQESLYGRLFGFGTNVAETLSGSDPSSIWENYMSQASTAADTLRRHPGPSAGALLLYEFLTISSIAWGWSPAGLYSDVTLRTSEFGINLLIS